MMADQHKHRREPQNKSGIVSRHDQEEGIIPVQVSGRGRPRRTRTAVMDVMENSEVGKVVTMMGAPLRQRLRSANDASTYAWFAFSAQGRKDAPPLIRR